MRACATALKLMGEAATKAAHELYAQGPNRVPPLLVLVSILDRT